MTKTATKNKTNKTVTTSASDLYDIAKTMEGLFAKITKLNNNVSSRSISGRDIEKACDDISEEMGEAFDTLKTILIQNEVVSGPSYPLTMTNTIAMTLAQKSDRILAQTRGLSGATPRATQLIEELRSALEAYRQENATLTDENELLRSTVTDCRIEIERTRAERDEARREICIHSTKEPYRQMCGNGILLPQDEANRRGWDCFKEVE